MCLEVLGLAEKVIFQPALKMSKNNELITEHLLGQVLCTFIIILCLFYSCYYFTNITDEEKRPGKFT